MKLFHLTDYQLEVVKINVNYPMFNSEFGKLTFRVLALCQSKVEDCESRVLE